MIAVFTTSSAKYRIFEFGTLEWVDLHLPCICTAFEITDSGFFSSETSDRLSFRHFIL